MYIQASSNICFCYQCYDLYFTCMSVSLALALVARSFAISFLPLLSLPLLSLALSLSALSLLAHSLSPHEYVSYLSFATIVQHLNEWPSILVRALERSLFLFRFSILVVKTVFSSVLFGPFLPRRHSQQLDSLRALHLGTTACT